MPSDALRDQSRRKLASGRATPRPREASTRRLGNDARGSGSARARGARPSHRRVLRAMKVSSTRRRCARPFLTGRGGHSGANRGFEVLLNARYARGRIGDPHTRRAARASSQAAAGPLADERARCSAFADLPAAACRCRRSQAAHRWLRPAAVPTRDAIQGSDDASGSLKGRGARTLLKAND